MIDKLLQIINHYGLMKQLKYIHSEYFELDEAILEAERFEPKSFIQLNAGIKKYVEHIAEELADIQVMLKQFQYHYGITDEEIQYVIDTINSF